MEKKKTEGLVLDYGSGPGLPDEIVSEILTRLPAKQIGQCKCVSKVWRSITEHPSFAKLYRSHNPLCLVSSVRAHKKGSRRLWQRMYYSTFGSQPEPSLHVFEEERSYVGLGGITQVLNGLCCHYYRNRLLLRNVFTGESMKLPLPKVSYTYQSPEFYFGFDRVSGVYKLLSLNPVHRMLPGSEVPTLTCQCDILTLGSKNPSWRSLPDSERSLHFHLTSRSFFVNGALYWIAPPDRDSSDHHLECFNLTDEKFSVVCINLPEPEKLRKAYLIRAYLVQFRGRVSLLASLREKMIVYTLGDDDDDKVLKWSRHAADLPGEFWRDFSDTSVPVGNLPTGELLLTNPNIDSPVTPVYSYDDRSKKFERLIAGKLPPSLYLRDKKAVLSVVSCMEQNSETLDALLRGGGSGSGSGSSMN